MYMWYILHIYLNQIFSLPKSLFDQIDPVPLLRMTLQVCFLHISRVCIQFFHIFTLIVIFPGVNSIFLFFFSIINGISFLVSKVKKISLRSYFLLSINTFEKSIWWNKFVPLLCRSAGANQDSLNDRYFQSLLLFSYYFLTLQYNGIVEKVKEKLHATIRDAMRN